MTALFPVPATAALRFSIFSGGLGEPGSPAKRAWGWAHLGEVRPLPSFAACNEGTEGRADHSFVSTGNRILGFGGRSSLLGEACLSLSSSSSVILKIRVKLTSHTINRFEVYVQFSVF